MIWRRLTVVSFLDNRRISVALTVLTAVVVASVAAGVAGLTWRLAGLNDGRDRVALATTIPDSSVSVDVSPILSLAPFGGAASDVQTSASGMILKAVFMAYPAEASSALIAVGEAPALAVRSGQTLSGGAIVQSIGLDHVVLLVGGQSERLEFPKPFDPSGAAVTPGPASPAVSLAPASAPIGVPTSRPATTTAGASGMVLSVVEQYRQRLAGNPQAVASQLDVTATSSGFRVGDNPPPQLRAAGLQPGDVVESVNNRPVGGLGDASTVLDQAITSGGARVEVLRNGRRVTFSFPLR